ncbi:GNAT family N-acetyltransferase [Methylosinus sp. RM1]|uniref:GNAT family N-acetyltransferase n=1 Tax=Methylosinus sp. RM1 TaxID=2583817 RepID=UPI00140B6ECD|nr:GNAT family N-acetyltransferase [Methylosinus sp. RM1]
MITGELALGSKACPDWNAVDELRRLCWRDRLADLSTLDDGHDGHAMHFLVRDGGGLVAAARLCIHRALADTPDRHLFPPALMAEHRGPYGSLNRLVVAPSHRNRHISLLLDDARIEMATRLGCRTMLMV